jgi:hypothetical protein
VNALRDGFVGFLIGIALTCAVTAMWQWRAAVIPAEPGAPSRETANQPIEEINLSAPLKVYSNAVKRKLGLPPVVASADQARVLASTTTAGNDRPQTVTAVLDTKSGTTQLFVRKEPLPWFSLQRHGELALAYGYQGSRPVTQLEGSYDLIQIKRLRLGLTGRVEQGGRAFAGMRAAIEW